VLDSWRVPPSLALFRCPNISLALLSTGRECPSVASFNLLSCQPQPHTSPPFGSPPPHRAASLLCVPTVSTSKQGHPEGNVSRITDHITPPGAEQIPPQRRYPRKCRRLRTYLRHPAQRPPDDTKDRIPHAQDATDGLYYVDISISKRPCSPAGSKVLTTERVTDSSEREVIDLSTLQSSSNI
jgi:hypothetical protein